MSVLIIGIGNEFRGDDAAGILVARRMRGKSHLRVIEISDGSGLTDLWDLAQEVVILDAMSSGATAGAVRKFDFVRQPLPAGYFGLSTHRMGVAQVIELARHTQLLPLSVVVYGIEGKNFAVGQPPSPEVSAAAEKLADELMAEYKQT